MSIFSLASASFSSIEWAYLHAPPGFPFLPIQPRVGRIGVLLLVELHAFEFLLQDLFQVVACNAIFSLPPKPHIQHSRTPISGTAFGRRKPIRGRCSVHFDLCQRQTVQRLAGLTWERSFMRVHFPSAYRNSLYTFYAERKS
jgi:hypothetical protein